MYRLAMRTTVYRSPPLQLVLLVLNVLPVCNVLVVCLGIGCIDLNCRLDFLRTKRDFSVLVWKVFFVVILGLKFFVFCWERNGGFISSPTCHPKGGLNLARSLNKGC